MAQHSPLAHPVTGRRYAAGICRRLYALSNNPPSERCPQRLQRLWVCNCLFGQAAGLYHGRSTPSTPAAENRRKCFDLHDITE